MVRMAALSLSVMAKCAPGRRISQARLETSPQASPDMKESTSPVTAVGVPDVRLWNQQAHCAGSTVTVTGRSAP